MLTSLRAGAHASGHARPGGAGGMPPRGMNQPRCSLNSRGGTEPFPRLRPGPPDPPRPPGPPPPRAPPESPSQSAPPPESPPPLREDAAPEPNVPSFEPGFGPRYQIEQIIVSGNHKTKTELILREIGLQPGDVISASDQRVEA